MKKFKLLNYILYFFEKFCKRRVLIFQKFEQNLKNKWQMKMYKKWHFFRTFSSFLKKLRRTGRHSGKDLNFIFRPVIRVPVCIVIGNWNIFICGNKLKKMNNTRLWFFIFWNIYFHSNTMGFNLFEILNKIWILFILFSLETNLSKLQCLRKTIEYPNLHNNPPPFENLLIFAGGGGNYCEYPKRWKTTIFQLKKKFF